MSDTQTPFIVTIDAEGDNLWARPNEITTRNAEFLPRFQGLCERYGLKPVYLANYEMATSAAFHEFAGDVVRRGAGEIGMHLHAWNSPPLDPLTGNDHRHHPYLIEFDESVMRDKIRFMTQLLENRFDRRIESHRAGRWGLDDRYAAILGAEGYRVDCSVTPGIDWRANTGAPTARGGPDFRQFPRRPYFLDPSDIARPVDEGLLEVPMTVWPSRLFEHTRWLYEVPLLRRAANRVSPGLPWLCPIQPTLRAPLGRHLSVMLRLARRLRALGDVSHLEFMMHSSELMPGGSPDFRTESDIERLYEHLEVLFAEAVEWCRGVTLADFAAQLRSRRAAQRSASMETAVRASLRASSTDVCAHSPPG